MAFATLCLSLTKRTGKAAANKKIAKQLALQFALYGDNGVVEQLYQFAGYTTQKVSSGIVATKGDENTFVAVEFTTKNCSVDRVIALSKTARNSCCNNLDLFCKNVDGELAKYVDLLPVAVTVYDAKSTTLLLTKYNKMPPLKITKKVSNTPILNYALNKKRAKSYFVSSAFTFALAFLSYWPLYNLAWATAFGLVGLYCLLNKRFNLKDQNIRL